MKLAARNAAAFISLTGEKGARKGGIGSILQSKAAAAAAAGSAHTVAHTRKNSSGTRESEGNSRNSALGRNAATGSQESLSSEQLQGATGAGGRRSSTSGRASGG